MEVMTLRQFADAEGVTYESVRRLVTKYAEDLGNHIYTKDNTRFLDEWALAFLREKRRQSPIIRVVEDRGEEIQALQDQIAALESQKAELTARLLAAQDKIAEAKSQTAVVQDKLIESQQRVIALQENETKYLEARLEVDGIRSERDRLRDAIDAAEAREATAGQTARLHQEEAERAREDAAAEKQRADDLQKEVERFRPSIFGFYRKV